MTYQVSANRTIIDPCGKRFIAKGAQMFTYLFDSFETRTDQRFRQIYSPAWSGPVTGISEPTYYASSVFVSPANIEAKLRDARASGVNMIRLDVEPAVMFTTIPYVDPTNGHVYPSDPDMLDIIVQKCGDLGLVIQLQQVNDNILPADNAAFMAWLSARYCHCDHVWINPANEPYGYSSGAAHVNDPVMWNAKIVPLVTALRTAGWVNPICIDPPGWADRVDLITGYLNAAPFSTDPNLIVNVHVYGASGNTDWRFTRLPGNHWTAYLDSYCTMIGEMGFDNFPGRLDPNLDPGIPSVNLPEFNNMISFTQDFLDWANGIIPYSTLNGVIGHMWSAWIPGLSMHDDNSLRRKDGTWTTWGNIFKNYYLQPYPSPLSEMQNVTGLTGARLSNGSAGTPLFQVEGRTGVRSAQMVIMQGHFDGYIGFHNRAAGICVGGISGNGYGKVLYNTASDYRIKSDVKPIEGHWQRLLDLEPVSYTLPDGSKDRGFIAHEFQRSYPGSVKGEKDGEAMQTMQASSAEVIADIVAAIKDLKTRT